MTILSVYWAPGHQRTTDIEYMQRLQPPAIRILDPDPNQLVIAHRAAPNALLLPRDWALSEQHDDVRRDPVGTGKRHAQDWRQKINGWRANGAQLPPDAQIIVVGINELRVWEMLSQAVEYTVAMLDECAVLGLRACALNLSVGWPANDEPGQPPNWTPYKPVEAAIQRGNHLLTLHEYWYRTGPQDGWGWFAGRLQHCPWDVPIVIGECGIDMYVDMERWKHDGQPNRGWRGNVDANTYAAQLEEYARAIDTRVVAILPFLTDYRSNNWESFDTHEAHNALLARSSNMVPQAAPTTLTTTHLPSISTGPKPVGSDGDTWARSIAWILKWEGGFQTNPADVGNYYDGKLIGTKYGISAASWGGQYDIPNLTLEQAKTIYYEHYWKPSGAASLPWPLCLLVMDTAVLHGTGTAQAWLAEVGPNAFAFAAKRLHVYTRLANWREFGAGWVNRTADLLQEVGK